ncbi:hypothetical protein DSM107010_69590 [Chroococcidiopsis cubana SAG 39.79]|uniref:Uncharacterized protein n=1 Tax=Chroococcidiopsis cubana SAG 39.79 TaxID=388085 RepID=A0AB37U8X1_9CYAN|nr:hypothetical protein [Chroococcidiopsis cubana]PSB66159.1 hypothetical protein C7B79_02205 [Chroococcidiopsis cubana CCALA 043]RUS98058.1 hypothetical protein DSM107010_69590 [Chroococcidiopsis cubana SAG 39.79]
MKNELKLEDRSEELKISLLTSERIQEALAVQEIFINNELQKKSEEIKASVLASENLHLKDLLAFTIEKASNTEEQLEISSEQVITLKEELRAANKELELYQQELDACHHGMVALVEEIQELTCVKDRKHFITKSLDCL